MKAIEVCGVQEEMAVAVVGVLDARRAVREAAE